MQVNFVHIAAVAAMGLTMGCGTMPSASTPMTVPDLSRVSAEQWQRLGQRRLLFAHQSVGGNVLDGVAALLKDHPGIPVRVIEIASAAEVRGPGLYHKKVGTNGQPDSKLAEFDTLTRDAFASAATGDVAMLKFCYADMKPHVDPDSLFAAYQREVEAVRRAHPGLTIVHVTMPLWVDTGIIDHVGTIILGKATPIRAINAERHRYNQLVRAAYRGREPFFDLAAYEATRADGSVTDVRYKGQALPSLAKEWTTDGGHLNDAAKRRLAEAFLVTLAQLP